jgi:hypothetical protein
MKQEISNIDSLEYATNTISNIKCNDNRNYWLMCYTFKHVNDKSLYRQGTSSNGKAFANIEEYGLEIFNYRGTTVYEYISVAEQFEMEVSAEYIRDFGISKTKLLARLKKENSATYEDALKNKAEIASNSVDQLLVKWFKQELPTPKPKLLSTPVKKENYEMYCLKAKKTLVGLSEKLENVTLSNDDIDRLYEFVCFLKNKATADATTSTSATASTTDTTTTTQTTTATTSTT